LPEYNHKHIKHENLKLARLKSLAILVAEFAVLGEFELGDADGLLDELLEVLGDALGHGGGHTDGLGFLGLRDADELLDELGLPPLKLGLGAGRGHAFGLGLPDAGRRADGHGLAFGFFMSATLLEIVTSLPYFLLGTREFDGLVDRDGLADLLGDPLEFLLGAGLGYGAWRRSDPFDLGLLNPEGLAFLGDGAPLDFLLRFGDGFAFCDALPVSDGDAAFLFLMTTGANKSGEDGKDQSQKNQKLHFD
jgi:hypothetical protein